MTNSLAKALRGLFALALISAVSLPAVAVACDTGSDSAPAAKSKKR